MSYVIAAPDLVQSAAQNLAGIRASLSEAAAAVAGPTTGVVPAAADEVSAAISALFGNFGQDFQLLSAQAQAFHAQFVGLMNAGAGAYLNTEIANAEQAAANAQAQQKYTDLTAQYNTEMKKQSDDSKLPSTIEHLAAATTSSSLRAAGWQHAQLGSLDPHVFNLALNAAGCAVQAGKASVPTTLTVIDYSKPSTQKRLWVVEHKMWLA